MADQTQVRTGTPGEDVPLSKVEGRGDKEHDTLVGTTDGFSDESEDATTEALRREFDKPRTSDSYGPYFLGAACAVVMIVGLAFMSGTGERTEGLGWVLLLGGFLALMFLIKANTGAKKG